VDSRERYREVLLEYKLDADAPGDDECWSPALETASRDRLREIQGDKLAAAVAYLYDYSPLYREKLDAAKLRPADIRDVEDLWKIPLLHRQELVDSQVAHPPWGRYSPISGDIWSHDGWILFATGGTTAAPRPFRMTRFDRDMAAWVFARGFWAMGVRPGDVGVFVFNYGAHIFFWEAQYGLNHIGCPVIPLGGADLKRRLDFQRAFRPTVLGTTASFALFMGETMKGQGIDPRESGVRVIFSGAEPGSCIPATKQRVESLWGAELHEWFGATEVGPSAHSCRHEVRRVDGPMNIHFLEDCYIVEVVDPQTFEPVAEGQDGVLVMSGLYSEGTPYPRYLLGDYCKVTSTPCGCGRTTMRAIGGMCGRMDDMLSIRGVHVYPTAIEEVVRRVSDITEAYEVVVQQQNGQDTVTVICEPLAHIPQEQWPTVSERVVREVSSALEVKVSVDLRPYGTVTREFKAKRIRDLRRE
jgi:phenylacetate-CoA ligase